MTYPDVITVTVGWKHLDRGKRSDNESPLALALREQHPDWDITVSENSVRIWNEVGIDARYWIPGDAWKLTGRHAAGQRVKPATFTLMLVYRKQPGGVYE